MSASTTAIGAIECIVIEGADARRFAQAQFSANVDALAPGRWQWNAWLDARGRVRGLMQLADVGDDSLLALLRGGDAATLARELARYRLRSRVELSPRVFEGRLLGPLANGSIVREGDDCVFGYTTRSLRLATAAAPAHDAGATRRWRLANIRSGWPQLPAGQPHFLPPDLGLERLGAVEFDKGCYPGQEIAARLHYRDTRKRRLCRLRGARPLPRGQIAGDGSAGSAWILDSAATDGHVEALAVIEATNVITINLLDSIYDVMSWFDP